MIFVIFSDGTTVALSLHGNDQMVDGEVTTISSSPKQCHLVLFRLCAIILLFTARDSVCISSYEPISHADFFNINDLESDFGTLDVRWCKSLSSIEGCASIGKASIVLVAGLRR